MNGLWIWSVSLIFLYYVGTFRFVKGISKIYYRGTFEIFHMTFRIHIYSQNVYSTIRIVSCEQLYIYTVSARNISYDFLLCITYVLFIVTCKIKFARLHQIFKFFKELSALESSFLISSCILWYLCLSHISHSWIRYFFSIFLSLRTSIYHFSRKTESLSEFPTSNNWYIFFTLQVSKFLSISEYKWS